MRRLDVSLAGCAHDVVECRGELQNLEAAFSEVAVAADVAVAKSEHVTELVSQRARRNISGSESDISADETMRGLSAGRQHGGVLRKLRRMRADVDPLSALGRRLHFANVEFQ